MGKNNSKIVYSRSTESLCTAVSLNSHADCCLLKTYGSIDNLDNSNELEAVSSQEETCNTAINTKASESISVEFQEQLKASSDVVIPEELLKKLTPEEWNHLFHCLFSSLDDSTVLLKLQDFHAKTINLKNSEKDTNVQYKDKNNLKCQHRLSCPCTCTSSHRKKLQSSTCSSKCLVDASLCPNSHSKLSTCAKFVETKQKKKKARPQSTLQQNDHYLTLAELKDLGLALRHESANFSDRQSAFSMQCWPSIDVSETRKKEHRLTRRKRSKKASSSQGPPITMEQLCYLGPNVSRVEETPGNTSAIKPQLPKNDLEIKHTYQHHHFHHIIHHSISLPTMPASL